MDDLLDDDFGNEEEQKDKEKRDLTNALKPHLQIKALDVEEVALLLDDNDILHETQVGSAFDNTGLIPLTGNQLANIKTTFFIQEKDIPVVDKLMGEFFFRKSEEAKKSAADDRFQGVMAFIVVITIIVLWVVKELLKNSQL